jgi:hypothetical protein
MSDKLIQEQIKEINSKLDLILEETFNPETKPKQ